MSFDYSAFTTNYKQPEYLVNGELQTLQFRGTEIENTGFNNFGFASSNADLYKGFNTFRVSEGIDYFSSNITYIFFTKPMMNLISPKNINDDFIRSLQVSEPSSTSHLILEQLDALSSTSGCFNMLLSNTAESFDLKDNILKTKEVGETRMGSKIILGDNSMESYNSDSFTIQYTELSDMSITKMHKTWVDYIHLVKHNEAAPYMCKSTEGANALSAPKAKDDTSKYYYSYTQNQSTSRDFVQDKVLDYVCSVYYFRTAEDGCTLKYWAKYTGVFPLNVPFSAMSFSMGENKLKQLSVNYTYSFKEDMNTAILLEFQHLCNNSGWKFPTGQITDIRDNWAYGVCLDPTFTKLIFIGNNSLIKA